MAEGTPSSSASFGRPVRPVLFPVAAQVVAFVCVVALAFGGLLTYLLSKQYLREVRTLLRDLHADLAVFAPEHLDTAALEAAGMERRARGPSPAMESLLRTIWTSSQEAAERQGTAPVQEFALVARKEGAWRVLATSAFGGADRQLPFAGEFPAALPPGERFTNFAAGGEDDTAASLPVLFVQCQVAHLLGPGLRDAAAREGWDLSDARLTMAYYQAEDTGFVWHYVSGFVWPILLFALAFTPMALFGGLRLASRAARFRGALDRVAKGDFSARIAIRTYDEVGQVADHFNNMVASLEETERLRGAIGLASRLQASLLPRTTPSCEGFRSAARNIMSQHVGGDYYDFIRRGDTLWVAVGDISGHGLESGLMMASARANLRLLVDHGHPLEEIIERLNHRLCDDLPNGEFFTLALLEIDASRARFRHFSAGHEPSLLVGRGEPELLPTNSPPLGLFPGLKVRKPAVEGSIEPGQRLIVLTDGLRECMDPAGRLLGHDPILRILRESPSHAGPDDVLASLLAAADAHRGPAPWEDDVTVVVLQRD